MLNRLLHVALHFSVWIVPHYLHAAEPGRLRFPHGATLHLDEVYSRPDAKTKLQLDLVRPHGKGPFPVVVFVHGGGWVMGSRKTYLPYMVAPVEQGYVAVAVSYRLAPQHPFPAALHDVKCAIRWLRANAAQFGIDAERIGVVGYSAGGNLVSLLGTTADVPALEGKGGSAGQSSRVRAVVSYYGIADVPEMQRLSQSAQMPFVEQTGMQYALSSYFGDEPTTRDAAARLASPVRHVHKQAAPMLLIHGTRDQQVPLEQSQRFEARLKEVGVEASLLKVEGAVHNFIGEHEKTANAAMYRFLERHLQSR